MPRPPSFAPSSSSASLLRISRPLRIGQPIVPQCLVARRYASKGSKDESEGLSFKGQLYESTHERVLKEKAERAKYSAIRDARPQGVSSQLLGWGLGMWHNQFIRENQY